jgi:hypothetical protein
MPPLMIYHDSQVPSACQKGFFLLSQFLQLAIIGAEIQYNPQPLIGFFVSILFQYSFDTIPWVRL